MNRNEAAVIFQATRGLTEKDTEQPGIQRSLLRDLCAGYGPRGEVAPAPEHGAHWKPPSDFADQLYSKGVLRPVSYCYLALIVTLLRLDAEETAVHLKLWGYVRYEALTDEQRERFITIAQREGFLSDSAGDRESQDSANALKELGATMLRYVIHHYRSAQIREVLRWLNNAYRSHFEIVLTESTSNEKWLANLSELVPRLLLKNLVPIYDSVSDQGPRVVLGADFGFYDEGFARASSLYRSLFDADELRALAQEAQRSSEIFAHAYPRFFRGDRFSAGDVHGLLIQWQRHEMSMLSMEQLVFSTQILSLYVRRGRLHARMLLEDEYRRFLTIPKVLYDELHTLFGELDAGGGASTAIRGLLDARGSDAAAHGIAANMRAFEREIDAT